MGINITINKNPESVLGKFEKELIKKIEKEKTNIEDQVLDLVDSKLKEFYQISVLQFYNDYPNPIYDRRGSLEYLFRTKKEGSTLKFWFEPSEIVSRTGYSGEDGLYTTVFKEGWHGGANNNGTMRYRTPIPYYRYWGKNAVQTFSAYDMFISLKEDYEMHGFRNDYKTILKRQLGNIGIKIH